MPAKGHWLLKSEAEDYSIDDLERDGQTPWTGVRNYEARNLMRDDMAPGDLVLYYHSNAKPSGVVGIAKIVSEPYPDPTQFDRRSSYFDARSTREAPRWWLVDVEFVEKLPRTISLAEIRQQSDLQEMALLKRLRLSVQPVTPREFARIRELAAGDA